MLWSGATGLSRGEAGERYGQALELEQSPKIITPCRSSQATYAKTSTSGRTSLLSPQSTRCAQSHVEGGQGAAPTRAPNTTQAAVKLTATR